MTEIGLYQAKTRLSALVATIEATGKTFALTRHGKIVAELRPPARSTPKRGCLKSTPFQMSEDFDADDLAFEDFWSGADLPGSLRSEGKSGANRKAKP